MSHVAATSQEEQELIVKAAKNCGLLHVMLTLGHQRIIFVPGHTFGKRKEAQTLTAFANALDKLVNERYLEAVGPYDFRLTPAGKALATQLGSSTDSDLRL